MEVYPNGLNGLHVQLPVVQNLLLKEKEHVQILSHKEMVHHAKESYQKQNNALL